MTWFWFVTMVLFCSVHRFVMKTLIIPAESCLFVLITLTRCAILKMTRNLLGLENRRPYYR